jgi:hypothetical protein
MKAMTLKELYDSFFYRVDDFSQRKSCWALPFVFFVTSHAKAD